VVHVIEKRIDKVGRQTMCITLRLTFGSSNKRVRNAVLEDVCGYLHL